MTRDPHIPLALWISAAIVAHAMGGGGAIEVARVYEDRASFRMLVQGARAGVRPGGTTFELVDIDAPAPPPQEATAAPANADEPDTDAPAEPDPTAERKLAKADPAAKPREPEKKPEPKPEPEKKPEPKPEPEKKSEVVAATPVVTAAPPPTPPADHRIAVRQHAKPDQEDNPTANRIADDANHTDEETVARIRSHDQDEVDPTPGAAHAGPRGEIGDADETKVAQSEDKAGDPTHGPGESKPTSTSPEHSVPPSPAAPAKVAAAPAGAGKGSTAKPAHAMPPSPPSSPSPGGAGPAAPEVVSGERGGGFTIDPANPGGDGQSRSPGRRRAASYQNPVDVRAFGLGARGAPGGLNLNVDIGQVEAAVGDKQLRAERAADGESRKSKHRGSFDPGKFERWRAAIENYEPSVKLGNQTSLNAARVPFATYINSIHNRLHPIFAEEFLASLDNLPTSHQLNQDLVTHLEIVLSREEGRIVRMGVTRQSGSTAFDIVALNSVQRASPFGKAPEAIVSPDGNVYLHWEFHRDPFDACTTRNARPFLLKSAPEQPAAAPMPKRLKSRSSDDRRDLPPPLVPMR